METMTVWTIQNLPAWEFFQQHGTLSGQETYIEPELQAAYEWMRAQLIKRIPGYGGGWPVWLWVGWGKKRKRPDLRARWLLPSGTKGMRIELIVPQCQVLISDFNLWHCVLNNAYCGWTEIEQEGWYRREDSANVPVQILQAEKVKSWERCFDLTTPRDIDWLGNKDEVTLQGCIEAIHLTQVTNVTPFTAR